MNKKFASLHFVETLDQIPVKLSIVKNAPGLLRDWYIDKFIPYFKEDIEIFDEKGYNVHLPLRPADASMDHERANRLTRRILQDLMEQDVDILLPLKDCPFDFPQDLPIADGIRLFPYFIMDAIEKALKMLGRSLKNTEIAILADNPFLTQSLLYNIYPHVNFLSVMTCPDETDAYSDWADFIFSDTGLHLGVHEKSKTLLAEADVIVDTAGTGACFGYAYKRGSVYFDFGTNKNNLLTLAGVRADLLPVNGLKIFCGENGLFLPQMEAAFYVKSKTYRTLLRRGFSPDLAENVSNELKRHSLRLTHLCFREQPLTNLYFAKRTALPDC